MNGRHIFRNVDFVIGMRELVMGFVTFLFSVTADVRVRKSEL